MTTTEFESNHTNEEPRETNKIARRSAFAAVGGLAAAALVTAGSSTVSGQTRVPTRAGASVGNAPRQAAPPEGDLTIGALAASLEVLAVSTYQAALDAAGSGALGAVPPAVAEYVTTARDQHQEHLDAWNGVLAAAGKPRVSAPPADLAKMVNDQFARVTTVVGAAQLALWLEQVAADTYLFAIKALESPEAITLAGSIFPIDRQHQSILLFVLGMYPVPQVFANTDMAYTGTGSLPPGATAPESR